MGRFEVAEASIAHLRAALETGQVTSEGLLVAYHERIGAYDRAGPSLNSIVVPNPQAGSEARAADQRRRRGQVLGPLDGIPFTAKNSYAARGLTVAAGSPAFEHLVAQHDSFVVGRLRAAGAVLVGLTNMPPMANGGMQRGLYGRPKSPYDAGYLTAAFASGSSSGSGTATAASLAAFGLGEETWSSGRSPASNNALCAYTPSRGLISMRGSWPLVPTMDVVVPHTRTMADLLEVLEVLIAPDPQTRGDFWRAQPWIDLPAVAEVRPASYRSLTVPDQHAARRVLGGLRLGVPRMYVDADPDAGTAPFPGVGGATGTRIHTRASVLDLWHELCADLQGSGASVVDVDFPAVSNYEGDRPGAPTIATRGLVDPEFLRRELLDLSAWGWDDFLRANDDPGLHRLADVDGSRIFPHPEGSLPRPYPSADALASFPDHVREHGVAHFTDIPHLAAGAAGLERTRRLDLEDWMVRRRLDAVIFPAVADVAPADADTNPASAQIAWRNGVWVANGNLVPRHLGIPTVTVPMGTTADTGMPVGVTVAGRAYHDSALLRLAAAIEATRPRRTAPPRTPPLHG